jgi:hypothetical protein
MDNFLLRHLEDLRNGLRNVNHLRSEMKPSQ